MKRLLTFILISVFALSFAFADEKASGKKSSEVILEGEIVDSVCYLDHGAKGESHKSCAVMCINGGAPIGLATKDGLYILTVHAMDEGSSKILDTLKNSIGSVVKIKGTLLKSKTTSLVVVSEVNPVK